MRRTLLVTGAAGLLGGFLQRRPPEGWTLRLTDVTVPPAAGAGRGPGEAPGTERRELDVTDPAATAAACEGVDAILHLGGVSNNVAATRDLLIPVNVGGTRNLLDAAAGAGVRRVLLAGSNHAVGFHPRPPAGLLPDDVECRPDSLYGVTKAAMEALGGFYADRYGIEVVLLRIGSCFERPTSPRMLSTWLSPADFCRLVEATLRAPVTGCRPVWGVSANTRRWWSAEGGDALGYHPRDDAEVFAPALAGADAAPDPRGETVGGSFPAAPAAGTPCTAEGPR
ncbi:NAD-dependent epimerase/dehydratase family protein [Streptomyces sp. NPDC049040]|uniref:NAD-dependent epimerase/dehydratase family protein n=1 Tax=Streptomyces sp. NPDC049040 TaxID=3365593 RepID=UPI0037177A9F